MQMLDVPVPEYFVTHIGKVESVTGGNVRLFMCVQRGSILVPRYSCVWPVIKLLTRTELVRVVGHETLQEQAFH